MMLLLCSGAYAQPDKGSAAHWDFDEGQGDVLHDKSGSNNHGKIQGAKWVRCDRGFVLRFDGKDDNVVIQPSDSLKFRDAVTIEAWAMPLATAPKEPGIVGAGADITTHCGFTVYSERVYFYISHGRNNCSAKLEKGKWQHLAGTFDGKRIKLYVNGELRASRRSKYPTVTSGDIYFIGRSAQGFFNGFIDEARFYNRALSAEGIKASYRREAPNKPTRGSAARQSWGPGSRR